MPFWLQPDGTLIEADIAQPGWQLFDDGVYTDVVSTPITIGQGTVATPGPVMTEVLARSTSIPDVSRSSYIEPTMRLSDHLTLANFTTGMMNGYNSFAPIITSHLIDPTDRSVAFLRQQGVKALLSHWRIAANLQNLAYSVVEPLLKQYGNDLLIYATYLNPTGMGIIGDKTNKHFTGEAITFYLRSAASNMYLEADNILAAIRGQYTHAFLFFGGHSWLQVLTNGPFSYRKDTKTNPVVRTFDLLTGDSEAGISPMRGVVKNPWAVPEFSPMRTLVKPRKYR